ncbi:uncharacterized protein LOC121639271 [Melanotaenia boesemani]|uniref:uncharacterized protein LOC121639271 n=1 Tax=Melanotaenia boesemani TaxID=1250792 RepID=UPI001C03E834|nr:uncharacterized protein LOC121639271 [Melanotaenia boesemani]
MPFKYLPVTAFLRQIVLVLPCTFPAVVLPVCLPAYLPVVDLVLDLDYRLCLPPDWYLCLLLDFWIIDPWTGFWMWILDHGIIYSAQTEIFIITHFRGLETLTPASYSPTNLFFTQQLSTHSSGLPVRLPGFCLYDLTKLHYSTRRADRTRPDRSPVHIYIVQINSFLPFTGILILLSPISGFVTITALITENKATYRDEVLRLEDGCSVNNLSLNATKTKEVILDFRKNRATPPPLFIDSQCVERVESFKHLEVHIAADLTWTVNTAAVVKKAQQRLHFLRILRREKLNT